MRIPLQLIPAYDSLPQSNRTIAAQAIVKPSTSGLGFTGPLSLGAGAAYQSVQNYYCVGFDYFYVLFSPGAGDDVSVNAVIIDPIDGATELIEVPWGTATGAGVINKVSATMPGHYAFALKFFGAGGGAFQISNIFGLYMAKL